MMVDGRYPMLGSNRNKALASIKKALEERTAASLRLGLKSEGGSRVLSVETAAKTPEAVDREVLVCAAATEDPVSTEVPSGENAGKIFVEYHAERFFVHKVVKLTRDEVETISFSLIAGKDWIEENCRVAVFDQDQQNGKVYQADALPWSARPRSKNKAAPSVKAGRRSTVKDTDSQSTT